MSLAAFLGTSDAIFCHKWRECNRGKDIGDYWDVFKFICVYSPDTATYWLVNPSISMKGKSA